MRYTLIPGLGNIQYRADHKDFFWGGTLDSAAMVGDTLVLNIQDDDIDETILL